MYDNGGCSGSSDGMGSGSSDGMGSGHLTNHSQLNVLPAKQWHSQHIADARAQHTALVGHSLKLLGHVPQGAKVS